MRCKLIAPVSRHPSYSQGERLQELEPLRFIVGCFADHKEVKPEITLHAALGHQVILIRPQISLPVPLSRQYQDQVDVFRFIDARHHEAVIDDHAVSNFSLSECLEIVTQLAKQLR